MSIRVSRRIPASEKSSCWSNLAALWLIALILICPGSSLGGSLLSFSCITGNSGMCEGVASQMSLSWDLSKPGTLQFVLSNQGPLPSAISGLYWEDDRNLLSSITSLQGSSGVKWQVGASPSRLPAGSEPEAGFQTDTSLSSSAKVPKPFNGINPGEWLVVKFALNCGVSYDAIDDALGEGALRAGIHVISLGPGQQFSESMITSVLKNGGGGGGEVLLSPAVDIPEPPAGVLAFGGLLLFVVGNLCRGRIRRLFAAHGWPTQRA